MYHMRTDKDPLIREETIPSDCFAERVNNWLWVMGVFIFVIVIYSIVTLLGQADANPSGEPSPAQGIHAQSVALVRCPYGRGLLDGQNNCSNYTCPLYSPNWQGSIGYQGPSGRIVTVALRRCPYCPGFLDAQGRCNVPECPVYSPDFGQPANAQAVALGGKLIKEVAIEVVGSAEKGGVIISSVYLGGQAEKAGLQAGDRIYRFNGRRVKSLEQFQSLAARAKAETDVKVRILRGTKKMKLTVRIGEGEMEGVTIPSPKTAM